MKHFINDISYSRDFIQCICGWEGKAKDDSFRAHKKEAPLIEEGQSALTFTPQFEGTFIRRKVAGIIEKY